MLKIYVGYDSREDIAWEVCRYSLLRHAVGEVSISPLKQPPLRELGLYRRPADKTASTEFSLTRFLTPFLADTDGWSMFVDCDFLFTGDITAQIASLDPSKAVYVVQHEYTPQQTVKMDGKTQTHYPRKNWSSMMLFNGRHPDVQALRPDVVNTAEPAHLHRFNWIRNAADIGALDLDWNFLVGEYEVPDKVPTAIHYTNGGPWFPNWIDVDYGQLWTEERDRMLAEHDAQAA
ncbi:hypothetical protein ACIQTU_02695 [Brevundimonas sp. NPDC090276]|uniref:hypothetical protein n=1 Tax=Brevundimonas sp. NPDC090276 TaxID=3363956 RepID=UPI00383BEE1D